MFNQVAPDKMDDAAFEHLTALAELKPYDGAVPDIATHLKSTVPEVVGLNVDPDGVSILLDKISCNLAIHTLLTEAEGISVLEEKSGVGFKLMNFAFQMILLYFKLMNFAIKMMVLMQTASAHPTEGPEDRCVCIINMISYCKCRFNASKNDCIMINRG